MRIISVPLQEKDCDGGGSGSERGPRVPVASHGGVFRRRLPQAEETKVKLRNKLRESCNELHSISKASLIAFRAWSVMILNLDMIDMRS